MLPSEVLTQAVPLNTEGDGHRALRVGIPIARLAAPICRYGLFDRPLDFAAAMARKTHPDRDLGIDPRRVDGLTRALPGDIRQVTPIDVRWRLGRHDLGHAVRSAVGRSFQVCESAPARRQWPFGVPGWRS